MPISTLICQIYQQTSKKKVGESCVLIVGSLPHRLDAAGSNLRVTSLDRSLVMSIGKYVLLLYIVLNQTGRGIILRAHIHSGSVNTSWGKLISWVINTREDCYLGDMYETSKLYPNLLGRCGVQFKVRGNL